MDYKRSLYNIGLNGNGYLLTNIARKRPRIMSQSSVFGTRFAQGDRSYLDFNLWWYWAQSEWSNGFKDTVSWADDGKYYFSSNIDAFTKVGSLQLMKGLAQAVDLTENISCGSYETIGGASYYYLGTLDGSDNKPVVYRSSNGTSYSNITSAWMPTGANSVSDVISHKAKLFILTIGPSAGSATYVVTSCLADGSSQTDHTGDINTAMSWTSLMGCHCGWQNENELYLGVSGYTNGGADRTFGIVKTTDGGTTWTAVFTPFVYDGNILCLEVVGTNIFYLVGYRNNVNTIQLRQYNFTGTPIDSLLQNFYPVFYSQEPNVGSAASRRLLHYINGKLIVTIPALNGFNPQIWSMDSNYVFTLLTKLDNSKYLLGTESTFNIDDLWYYLLGGIFHDNKIWWNNLMYDGTNLFNTKKNFPDDTTNFLVPVLSDGSSMHWVSAVDKSIVYKDSGYKGAAGKNFLVFNQNDVISTIDKIFHHATFNFNYLATGESIIIEYLLSDLTPTSNASWTSLGSASFSIDGAAINTKTIYFPDNAVGKKMWLRIKLEGSGSTTPTFNDIVIAYLPMPDLKHDWTLYLECYDNMMLLDGKTKETKRGEELKSLLKFNWWSKTAMDFQDVDYAETTLTDNPLTATATTINVSSTLDFSQQGRLRIEQEEIFYTGKNATSFTGCTRGARGSLAVAHNTATLVATNYKVIIQSLEEFTPELQNIKVKNEESVVILSLREL